MPGRQPILAWIKKTPPSLTSNQFLHGGTLPYTSLKLVNAEDVNLTPEYVPQASDRKKKMDRISPKRTVGDLVLVIEPNTLDGQWPLGKLIEVMSSESDNVVRVVKVKISNHKNSCIRPVT